MNTFLQDIRFGLRMLAKSPGFTFTAVSTLAVGVGAVTAIFSIVNAALIRPLPFDQPGQLVQLWGDPAADGRSKNTVAGTEFLDWKEQNKGLENISAFFKIRLNITGENQPELLNVLQVSANYLQTLHITPFLGRGYLPEEDQPGKNKVAILTHKFWQQYYGGDANRVGHPVRLGDDIYTVIGILPPKPILPEDCDVIVPFVYGSESWHFSRGDNRLKVIARLKPGVTVEQERAEMKAIKERLNPLYPEYKQKWGVAVVPLLEEVTGDVRPQLWILLSAVGFVLLIACANVANLLLVKAEARQKEIALRMALGGKKWRVIRQLLTESVMISLIGGSIGIILAIWGVDILKQQITASMPQMVEITIDGNVLCFALLASLVTGLLFGLTPVWLFTRSNLNEILKEGARSTQKSTGLLGGGLIVFEIALSLVLLTGAGLLLKTLFLLHSIPLGFNPENVLTSSLSLSDKKYPVGEARTVFLNQIIQQIESLPGVDAAGTVTTLPMCGSTNISVRAENQPDREEFNINTDYDFVSENYYRAMGIHVLKGRIFNELDNTASAPRVTVMNEALAKQMFKDEDPIGQHVRIMGESWKIIGLVDNVHHRGLDQNRIVRIYLPQAFSLIPNFIPSNLVVRTKVPPSRLYENIRREILKLDPDQPISNTRALEQIVTNSIANRHFVFLLLGIFSGVALLLAAIGLYGVMAQFIVYRTREIGIRMALGAQRGEVISLILKKGMKLTVWGTVAGLLGAFVLTRVLTHLLFGVAPTDPIIFAGVALLLGMVALLACYLPACRAIKIDPVIALRCE